MGKDWCVASDFDQVDYARTVLSTEASAITQVAATLAEEFCHAVEVLLNCPGRVVVMGVGKAGIIGQKVSATLASTGTPSHWMHPTEARHGDLGRVVKEDVVLALSNSGESDEMLWVIPSLKRIGARIIAITGRATSALGMHSDIVLEMGNIEEACPLGLAPSASTTAMLAIGDALALTVLRRRNFTKEEYAFYHPGGELGRRLLSVAKVMRIGDMNPIVADDATMHEALRAMTETRGSPGAAIMVDQDGRLSGIITDGDVRRRLLSGDQDFLLGPVRRVMTRSPKHISQDALASEALRMMREAKVDQLPVTDDQGMAVGIIDVQDLLDVDNVQS